MYGGVIELKSRKFSHSLSDLTLGLNLTQPGTLKRHPVTHNAAKKEWGKPKIARMPLISRWCGRRDLNPHDLRHWNLNPARLPIPPRPQTLRATYRLYIIELHPGKRLHINASYASTWRMID
jgi:hypothetical protein